MSVLTGLLTALGGVITRFFDSKDTATKAMLEGLKEAANDSESAKVAASAIIVAEAKAESWLTRTWRPLVMLIFMGLLLSSWLGYMPPGLEGSMPPVLDRIFDLLELGVAGYIGGRTLEKIVDKVALPAILAKIKDL